MPEFLTLLPPFEALDKLLSQLNTIPRAESISTADALGRVIAQDVKAQVSLPAFPRSTVDGYALRAQDTFGATDSLPAYLKLVGEVSMGSTPDHEIEEGISSLIHTGGMLPQGADAVMMIEYTQQVQPDEIEIYRKLAVGENVIQIGEDVAINDVVIPAGTSLRPAEIGGLMALGLTEIMVSGLPKVGIISSGDEVIPPTDEPSLGEVRDVNTYTLEVLVRQAGGEPTSYGILPDDYEAIRTATAQALEENDLVVITAGSSASVRDLTAKVINSLGKPGVLVHGVNIRPGKPTILGICDQKPIIGLPGNPVSALVVAGLFVVAVIEKLLGQDNRRPKPTISAQLSVNLSSQTGREDWVPVKLIKEGGQTVADPIFGKSNLIFTLVQADGLVHIPPNAGGLAAGEQVQVHFI